VTARSVIMMSTEPAVSARSHPNQPAQHYPQQAEDKAHLAKFLGRGVSIADIDNSQDYPHNGNEKREQVEEQTGF
jgi:hypothetical protein